MNPEQVEHVAQAPYDQRANNGHGHGAAPASEIHAADDAGGDGVELVCVTLRGVDGVQLGGQQQARHGGAEAGETEHEELQPGGAEAFLAQYGFVAAERIDVVAERREALNEKAQREESQQQQVGQGDAAKRAVANEYEALGEAADRAAAVHGQGQALADLAHHQRRDEGRNSQLGHHKAVKQAENDSGEHAGGDARRQVDPGEHKDAADHWAERQQAGQGQVDPLDDDDERHSHRADAGDGRLPDDVEQVRQVQEVRDLRTQRKEGRDGEKEE